MLKLQALINIKTLVKIVNDYGKTAAKLIKDKRKLRKILDHALHKTDQMSKSDKSKEPLENVWDGFQLAVSAIKDWISGSYRGFPLASIIAIVAGMLYFLSPMDLIPDFIPAAGFLDDASVIGFVLAQVNADLMKYKKWKKEKSVKCEV